MIEYLPPFEVVVGIAFGIGIVAFDADHMRKQ